MSSEPTAAAPAHKLQRDIGKWGAMFLVLNCVIGAGIYGLPGTLAEMAGTFSPWLFLIFIQSTTANTNKIVGDTNQLVN